MRHGLLFVFAISCLCFDRPCFAQAPSPQPASDLSQFYQKLEQRRSQNLLGGPLTDDSYELYGECLRLRELIKDPLGKQLLNCHTIVFDTQKLAASAKPNLAGQSKWKVDDSKVPDESPFAEYAIKLAKAKQSETTPQDGLGFSALARNCIPLARPGELTRARDYTTLCATIPGTQPRYVFESGLWPESLAAIQSLQHLASNPPQDLVQVTVLNGLSPSVTHSSGMSAAELASYFDCKLKEKVKTVFELSSSAYVASNLMDEQNSKLVVKSLVRSTAMVDYFAPAVLYISRSAPWRIGMGVIVATAGAAVIYQFVVCD